MNIRILFLFLCFILLGIFLFTLFQADTSPYEYQNSETQDAIEDRDIWDWERKTYEAFAEEPYSRAENVFIEQSYHGGTDAEHNHSEEEHSGQWEWEHWEENHEDHDH